MLCSLQGLFLTCIPSAVAPQNTAFYPIRLCSGQAPAGRKGTSKFSGSLLQTKAPRRRQARAADGSASGSILPYHLLEVLSLAWKSGWLIVGSGGGGVAQE
jgi:hypothetical protein